MYCVHFVKDLHFESLNQKMYMTYKKKNIDASCIRYQSLFIIYLCTKYHFIFFINKTNEGAYLGVQALLSSDFAHKIDSIEL